MDLEKIKKRVLSLTNYIKEIEIIEHNHHPFALIYPDFKALQEAKIINIKEEIRWYAVELYNIKAKESEKIRGFKIFTTPLEKNISEALITQEKKVREESEPNDEIYKVLKSFLATMTDKEILPTSHLELDLELDSLNYVELFVFIEESFGVKMDEAIFSKMMKMEPLYSYVKNNAKKIEVVKPEWDELLREQSSQKLVYSPFIMSIYKTLLYPFFRLYFRLEVRGVENIPSTACIIAPSHQSMLDGFLIESSLSYKILKKTFFLAYKQVFGTKLLKPVAKHGQSILIDANENLKETMIYCALPIRSGNNLVIFPEGARTRDRELLEFRPYFAMLSKTFNAPVVPVVIDGSYEALGTGMLIPRPRKIRVTFLEPIEPHSMEYGEIVKRVRGAIKNELKKSKSEHL
ncbi:1-acyl-sn-glycerol-3-phosphate acyltransferase [Sulfurimonas sp.]|jgi:long-chain acyl-CoA synthetase|uniref:lysophospholipid acyltransferase family protein n=1 Tax=Sulfurimonas sp. TaxID=2022749 RepID=UPI002A36D991|nr:1-acyl-sn-glycerol-3-phosphate acyltransferase [Sulfurimonas sp.]MDY0123278.1 1-acyl-sn-glycerol-3-phosphate acyltransferase [Sulfurimonas sp.]